jgi:hypothetical protein
MRPKTNTCRDCGSPIDHQSTICYVCRNRKLGGRASKIRWDRFRSTLTPPNPSGLCQCGCGGLAPIAKNTDVAKGRLKDHPCRFIRGHGGRKHPVPTEALCGCGCGEITKPGNRFILGHWRRKSPNEYIVDPVTGCWLWQRSTYPGGYGSMLCPHSKKVRPAHCVIYERHKGPIPEGLELDHLCRNHACVNPDHLEPVTHLVNVRRGEKTKYGDEVIAEMTRLMDEGVSYRVIAERFGCPRKEVHRLVKRCRARAA